MKRIEMDLAAGGFILLRLKLTLYFLKVSSDILDFRLPEARRQIGEPSGKQRLQMLALREFDFDFLPLLCCFATGSSESR